MSSGLIRSSILNIQGAVPSGVTGSTSCNPDGLTCGRNEYVRCEKGGCDNNTCATALASPHACAEFIELVAPYCDCVTGYFKNSAGRCVTREQCERESTNSQGGSHCRLKSS